MIILLVLNQSLQIKLEDTNKKIMQINSEYKFLNLIKFQKKKMYQMLMNLQKYTMFQFFTQQPQTASVLCTEQSLEQKKIQRFSEVLANQNLNYEDIKKLSCDGIPKCIRAKIWKYLLKYVPGNKDSSSDILSRKRNQYSKLVAIYLPHYDLELIEDFEQRKIAKIIEGDVKRSLRLAKNDKIKQLLTRCLYIWHVRHPISGYVQGINDLIIPFFLVFLSEYYPINFDEPELESTQNISNDILQIIQADMYWCLSKMLDRVINNYVSGFDGIHQSQKTLQNLLKKIDIDLYNYLNQKGVDVFVLIFREISTFLLRLFSFKTGIRFFDTLISQQDNYSSLLVYVLIAIMIKFSKKIMEIRVDQIMSFFQDIPTKTWQERELVNIIRQAYVYGELDQKSKRKLI